MATQHTHDVWHQGSHAALGIGEIRKGIADWQPEVIENTFKQWMEDNELGFGAVGPNFRVLVTGKGMGPSLFEITGLLGQAETLRRIREGIPAVQAMKGATA